MRYLLLLSAQLIFSYSIAQNSLGFSFDDEKDFVELSFKDESNLIVVPILVNGEGPFNFILDSGSESGMIFDRFVISENNLVNARTIPIFAQDGKKITDLLVANNINIQLSGISGIQQSMVVLQEKDLVDIQSVLGVNANGVLGSELFSRFVIEIDYETKKLRLYEPKKFQVPKGFTKVPISIKNLRPYLNARLKQEGERKTDINLLIDTGASSALFLDADGYDNIKVPNKNIDYILGGSLAGPLNGQVGRIKSLQVGKKFTFKKVVTSFPESWQIKREIGSGGDSMKRHGTIGSDILSRFTIIFDYMNSAIYLKKTKGYRKRFRFNTSGLTLNTSDWDNKRLFVSGVIPNSPADKVGILPGDEIMSINDKPVFFYSFSDIVGFIRAVPGDTITLILMRDGKYFPRRIKLRKLI